MKEKSRYWSFIAYPESVKENWIDILSENGVVAAISPLHDRDITPEGEKKKPHWHILIEFEGPTTYKNVKENICDLVGGTIPKKVISIRGYYRYLTHMDNPEKAQYKQEDIITIGGFRMELTNSEVTLLRIKIMEDIVEKNFYELSDLADYYREIGDIDRLDLIMNKTYFIKEYICSRRNKTKNLTHKKEISKIELGR